MARVYYKSGWDICDTETETIYGSWKDGSDIYKDKKGYFVIQYEPKNNMVYKKHIKFTPNPEYVITRKIKSKKQKRCGKTRKTKKN
jgi:hypothetical protein